MKPKKQQIEEIERSIKQFENMDCECAVGDDIQELKERLEKTQSCHIEPLVKCNNCGGVFVDKNPCTNQPEFEVQANMQPLERVFVDTSKPELDYWACPNCLTDAALMDVEEYQSPK